MAEYPVRIKRASYKGHDRKKTADALQYNEDAALLERYIEKEAVRGTARFSTSRIAYETGIPLERVRKIISSIDGSGEGFVLFREG